MISAGKRDRRVNILQRQTSRGPSGDVQVEFVLRRRVWAQLSGIKARDMVAPTEDSPVWDARFTMRWFPDVEHSDRLEYNGVQYYIVLLNPIGRNEDLEIFARKFVQQ